MPSKSRSPEEELKQILSQSASPEEKDDLLKLGVKTKSPTKLTVVLTALYKKAAGGDLSAIKELLCRLSPEEALGKGVVFIDDIKGSDE